MKVNQQQQLHPHQQQLLILSFVVRRATNQNPAHENFVDAWAAARYNIAAKSASARIGVQEDTSKSASD